MITGVIAIHDKNHKGDMFKPKAYDVASLLMVQENLGAGAGGGLGSSSMNETQRAIRDARKGKFYE